jgi:predicted ATPase/DNA-binding CsgD family transcriptional regulator
MTFQKKVSANDKSGSPKCGIRPHFLAEFDDCRYGERPDKLVLGEQKRVSASAYLPNFSMPGSRDAGRCPVMTADKELFGDTLPTYLTRFVGRDREIATVLSRLHPGRLVTISGVGGAGKTRLAIEVAKRSRGGPSGMHDAREVYFVPLDAVVDPTEVRAAVAAGIGIPGQLGDRPLAPIVRALTNRRALLVLDNCEQVADACQELVVSLLAACPTVTVLATTRIPLDLPDEQVFAIPPMGSGALRSNPFESDAVALFLDRASSVAGAYALTEHNAKTLTEICDVLHGLPLGIELAASWIPVLSPRDLLDHLRQADIALASGTALVEDRHRSLAVILDSSWRWLSTTERAVLSSLAIFVGGFTREAAEVVADANLGVLAALAERSLIQRLPDSRGGSRYQVHELIRHHALHHLADDGPTRTRHFAYFLELVEALETSWNTQPEPLWFNPIGADLANISAAMMWVLDQGDAEGALRLAVGLGRFWPFSVASPAVRLAQLRAALALPWSPSGVISIRARARAYWEAGVLQCRADPAAAQDLQQQGLVLFQEIGDEAGVARCILNHGAASLLVGDSQRGRREIAESLARCQACDDALGVVWAYDLLGIAGFVIGDYAEASSYLRQSATQFESLGAPLGACHALVDLGLSLRYEGKLPSALNAYRQALRYQREYRFTTESADSFDGLAVIAASLGHLDLAAKLFGAAAGWREAYQDEQWFPMPNDFQERADGVRRRVGERAWFEAYGAGGNLNSEGAMSLAEEAVFALEEELQRRSAGLTSREIDVLHLVADGLTNAEIAERLVLSERTVHAHLRSIFDKLGVSSRTAAARAVASLFASR